MYFDSPLRTGKSMLDDSMLGGATAADTHQQVPMPSINSPSGGFRHDDQLIQMLRSDNRNLRLRMIYLDELLAKQGIDPLLAEQLSTSQVTIDTLQRELSSTVSALEGKTKLLDDVEKELQGLRGKENDWDNIQQELRDLHRDRDELYQLRQHFDNMMQAKELAERMLAEEQQSCTRRTEGLRRELELQLDECKSAMARADAQHSSEVSELAAKRLSDDEAFATQKAHLMEQVRERNSRLIEAEGLVEECRDRLKEAACRVESLERQLQDKDDANALLRHEIVAHKRNLEDMKEQHREELLEKDKWIAAEEYRSAENGRSAQRTEDVLLVVKGCFADLVEEAKLAASCPIDTDGYEELLQERAAAASRSRNSSPVRRTSTPTRGGSDDDDAQVTTPQAKHTDNALVVASPSRASTAAATRVVLNATINDCVQHIKHERIKAAVMTHEKLQHSFNKANMSLEDTYGTIAGRLRRLHNKIEEMKDNVQFTAKKAAKKRNDEKETLQEHQQAMQALAQRSANLEDFGQRQAAENDNLKAEVTRLSNALEQSAAEVEVLRQQQLQAARNEHVARMAECVEACTKKINNNFTACAADVRHLFVQTNVLTPQFIESVSASTHRMEQKLSSLEANVAVAARARSGSPQPLPPSQSGALPSSDVLASVRSQLTSFNKLLQNNYDMAQEVAGRVGRSLGDWETRVKNHINRFEDVAKAMQAAPSPHAVAAGAMMMSSGTATPALMMSATTSPTATAARENTTNHFTTTSAANVSSFAHQSSLNTSITGQGVGGGGGAAPQALVNTPMPQRGPTPQQIAEATAILQQRSSQMQSPVSPSMHRPPPLNTQAIATTPSSSSFMHPIQQQQQQQQSIITHSTNSAIQQQQPQPQMMQQQQQPVVATQQQYAQQAPRYASPLVASSSAMFNNVSGVEQTSGNSALLSTADSSTLSAQLAASGIQLSQKTSMLLQQQQQQQQQQPPPLRPIVSNNGLVVHQQQSSAIPPAASQNVTAASSQGGAFHTTPPSLEGTMGPR